MALTVEASGEARDCGEAWEHVEALVRLEIDTLTRDYGTAPRGMYDLQVTLVWDIYDEVREAA